MCIYACINTHTQSKITLQNTWNVYTSLITRVLGKKVKTKKFTAAVLRENI